MKTKHIALSLFSLTFPLVAFGLSALDGKIQDAARDSYNFKTVLDNQVKASSSEGIVTLKGTVQDNDQKMLAEDTVVSLPGVLQVKNEIEVKSTYAEHSDGWIAFKLRTALLMRSHVSASATTVEVKDGYVTLKGTADDAAQKELTGVYAKEIKWVKGVKNELVVNDKPGSRQTIGEKIDDASITSQVKYALLNHESTSVLKTKVTTNDGTVMITGEAMTQSEKALVSKLAGDVRGARNVTNDMTVRGE